MMASTAAGVMSTRRWSAFRLRCHSRNNTNDHLQPLSIRYCERISHTLGQVRPLVVLCDCIKLRLFARPPDRPTGTVPITAQRGC